MKQPIKETSKPKKQSAHPSPDIYKKKEEITTLANQRYK